MSNPRDILTVRPVGTKDIDQYNKLLKYVFQVSQQQLTESGYEDGELVRSKRPVLQEADVFGWFTQEDELVSQICIYPCQVNIHGTIYTMGGVTGVGTYPEYSGMGLMNDLIRLALDKMRLAGQYISYLYPYSVPYYRRKGWEIISDKITYSLKDSQIPHVDQVPGHVERLAVTDLDVLDVYDRFAHTNHGALIRNKFEWDEYWRWENEEERTAAVYYDSNDMAQGYLLYWVNGDIFHVKEMIYLTQEARTGLWNFIAAHHSMVDNVEGNIFTNEPLAFQLEESQIQEVIEPYYMGRIVDVEKFLENYPFNAFRTPVCFIVKDNLAPWNNGNFRVTTNGDGKVHVDSEDCIRKVELDIQTLTTMLMSYKIPSYLYKIERLRTDVATLRLLEDMIPDTQPYFSDYF